MFSTKNLTPLSVNAVKPNNTKKITNYITKGGKKFEKYSKFYGNIKLQLSKLSDFVASIKKQIREFQQLKTQLEKLQQINQTEGGVTNNALGNIEKQIEDKKDEIIKQIENKTKELQTISEVIVQIYLTFLVDVKKLYENRLTKVQFKTTNNKNIKKEDINQKKQLALAFKHDKQFLQKLTELVKLTNNSNFEWDSKNGVGKLNKSLTEILELGNRKIITVSETDLNIPVPTPELSQKADRILENLGKFKVSDGEIASRLSGLENKVQMITNELEGKSVGSSPSVQNAGVTREIVNGQVTGDLGAPGLGPTRFQKAGREVQAAGAFRSALGGASTSGRLRRRASFPSAGRGVVAAGRLGAGGSSQANTSGTGTGLNFQGAGRGVVAAGRLGAGKPKRPNNLGAVREFAPENPSADQ